MDPSTMTLREKISQLIFPRIGSNLPPIKRVAEDLDRISEMLSQVPIGGLCLFNGDRDTTPKTLRELQRLSKFPLLIAADMERGAGQQVKGLSVFPHAMAFGVSDRQASLEHTEQAARITAEQALAAGIHIVLGPVADVNSDPKNPIIATRAFSTDTEQAAELAVAYTRGCQSAGAVAAAKHFPGHGNTSEDSHETLPTVHANHATLSSRDLVPFQRVVDAGVQCVMTAHVAYPGLDTSEAPATISAPILTDLLRDELGFDGVIMTDSLLMAGVKSLFDNEVDMCVAVLSAGADVLLDVADPIQVADGLVACVRNGALTEDRIEQSFQRVWKMKQAILENNGEQVFADNRLSDEYASAPAMADAETLAHDVARLAIREYGPALPQPIPTNQRIGLVTVTPFESLPNPTEMASVESPLISQFRSRCETLQIWEHAPKLGDADQIVAEAANVDHLVIALTVRPAAWHRFGLLDEQVALVERLAAQTQVTLVSLGVPSVLDQFPNIERRICTFSDVDVSQHAIAEYLFVV